MGWYTDNADSSFKYKYGNVLRLVNRCRIGQLQLVPRILCESAEGSLDAEEFLGKIALHAQQRKYAWQKVLHFEEKHHEGFNVKHTAHEEIDFYFEKIRNEIRYNKEVFLQCLSELNHVDKLDTNSDEFSLHLSFETHWRLESSEFHKLLFWINLPLKPSNQLTISMLNEGTLEDEWYELPDDASHEIKKLMPQSEPYDFAIRALGADVVNQADALCLFQPDDDWQEKLSW